MRTIIEVLSLKESAKTQDVDELTAAVRPKLGRMIVRLVDVDDNLPVMTLNPALEQMLNNILMQNGSTQGLG